MSDRINKALEMIADSITSGYSALFTFAVKETLTESERGQVAHMIRELAKFSEPVDTFKLPLRTKL